MSLKDRIVLMDPGIISPFHEEMDPEHTKELAKGMVRNGWEGRPLVVMELLDGTIKGLTGSHRVRAAVGVGLRRIPVIQLTKKERGAILEEFEWFNMDRQKLYDLGVDAPLTEDIANQIYELRSSLSFPVADLLMIEDLGIPKFNRKAIDRLLVEGYSEEVVEVL